MKAELKINLSRELDITVEGQKYQFDAVSYGSDGATLVEVKVLLSNLLNKKSLHDTLLKMQHAYDALRRRGVDVKTVIAFAVSLEDKKIAILKDRIKNILLNYHFQPLVKYYDINELETELGLTKN